MRGSAITTTVTQEHTCPHCGRTNELHSGVCIYIDATGAQRKPTAEEEAKVLADPTVQRALKEAERTLDPELAALRSVGAS